MRVLLSLLLICASVDAYKYLVYNPKFGGSHAMLVGKVADEIAYGGHDVTVLQLNINPQVTKPGHTHKDIKLVTREFPNKWTDAPKNFWVAEFSGVMNTLNMMKMVGKKFRQACEFQLNDEELLQQLRNEEFDVGVTESFDVCGYGIFAKIGLNKTITISGSSMFLGQSANLGIPSMTSFVPDIFGTKVTGFIDRLKNWFTYVMGVHLVMPAFNGEIGKAFHLVPGYPDYMELIARTSFVLVNADEFVDYPRPISHKYLNVAGYGMRRAMSKIGSLDKEFADIFDKATKGVIYVSFGSMIKSADMPLDIRQAFIEAFASFPEVQFIWKYENASHNVAEGYSNIHTGNWLPQREILVHPKTLAFLTHAGMNSVTEATYSGVPMVCLPLFAEQPRNADMIVKKGVAVRLNKQSLTKEEIQKALKEIIENETYKQKSQTLAKLLRNKFQTPEEKIVKACELAAEFDIHKHLDMPGRTLNTLQFYNVDVIAFIITSVVLVLAIVFGLVRFLLRKISGFVFGKAKTE
ncbi:unnamed protein product [Bursaphelenchus okinawaensis]|uniref:glucuronosyltransferase n=1 Tax=Bursaphelenchus okinawaensis TaxID=465554 RepID=A0A811L1J8_9BILA|nr:unnamed protein product [Bursaphelenchus okinawaensis]CAG9115237.1 unnamed protein product [Bursaphelenchus okinawaensis]